MNRQETLKALVTEAQILEEKGTDLTEQEISRAEEIAQQIQQLKAEMSSAKKTAATLRAATHNEGETTIMPEGKLTIGEKFVKSEEVRAFREDHAHGFESKNGVVNFAVKDVASGKRVLKADPLNTGIPGASHPEYVAGIDNLVNREPRTILDLIYQGTTDSPWLQYRQLQAVDNKASVTSEAKTTTGVDAKGGLKPLSTLTTATADAKAFTYADGLEITNQELSDDGALVGIIDGELEANLLDVVEKTLINGSGTADEPAGILHTTGVLNQAFATDIATTLRKAKTLLASTSGTIPQAVVLNPEDNEALDLLQDKQGRYLGAGPFAAGDPTVWAIPRLESSYLAKGTAIMGDFSVIQLLVYEALNIAVFNQHKDYAQRNLSYIRAELRALQMIRKPAKLCVVNLNGANHA